MKQLSPTTKYLLQAFIPYSRANLRLTYKPNLFFYELEKKTRIKERSMRSAYYRAIKGGLVTMGEDRVPRLTSKGLSKIKQYKPNKLTKEVYLIVTFDIPESERSKRDHLRALLRELFFTKIQQSVWASKYDHRQYLAAEIKEFGLENYVIIYEAAQLPVK